MSRAFKMTLLILAMMTAVISVGIRHAPMDSFGAVILLGILAGFLLVALRFLFITVPFVRLRMFLFPTERAYVADLYHFLAQAVRAGFDPSEALASRANDAGPYWFRRRARALADRLALGEPLHVALFQFPEVFPAHSRAMVEAGERGGRLADTLEFLARIERGRALQSFPVFLVAVEFLTAPLIILFILVMVVPKFVDIFSQLGAELPAMTTLMIGVSAAIAGNAWIWINLILFGVLFAWVFRRSSGFWRTVLRVFPFLRTLVWSAPLSRFAYALGALLGAGVDADKSLRLACAASGSAVIGEHMDEMVNGLKYGDAIGQLIAGVPLLPARFRFIVSRAFRTEDPVPVLLGLADDYRVLHEEATRRLASYLLPATILLIGFSIGFFCIAMYLPMFCIPRVIGQ